MATETQQYIVTGGYGIIDAPVGATRDQLREIASAKFGVRFPLNHFIVPASVAQPQVPAPLEDKGSWFHEWVGRDLERGWDLLQATGDGLSAITANILGAPEWEAHALQDYQKEMEEVAENPAKVASYTDIENLGDALLYLKEGILESLPLMVPSLFTGGVGGVVGGKVAQSVATKAVEKTAEGLLNQLVARKIATYVPGLVAKGIPLKQAQQMAEGMAIKFFNGKFAQGTLQTAIGRAVAAGQGAGTGIGAWMGSTGIEAGLIAGEQYEETGKIDPGAALGYGSVAGVLDALPAFMVLKKVFGPATDDIKKGLIKRFGVEGAKQLLAEGGTEFAQTFIEKMGVSAMTGKPVFTEENFHEAVDAAFKGGGAGFVMGVGAEALRKTPSTPVTRTPDPAQTSEAGGRADLRTGEGQRGANDLLKLQGAKLQGSVLAVGKKGGKQKIHFTNPTTYENASIDQILFTTTRRLKSNRNATVSPETEALLENHYGKAWRVVGENFVNEVEAKRNQGAETTKVEPLAGSDKLLNYAVPAPSIPLKNIKGNKNDAFAKVQPEKIFDEKVYSFAYDSDKALLVDLQKKIAEGKDDSELAKEFGPRLDAVLKQMQIPLWDSAAVEVKDQTFSDAVKSIKNKLGIPDKTNKPEFDSWKLLHDVMTGKAKSPAPKQVVKPPPPANRQDRIALAYQNIKAKQYENFAKDFEKGEPVKGLSKEEIKQALDDAGLKTNNYDDIARIVLSSLGRVPLEFPVAADLNSVTMAGGIASRGQMPTWGTGSATFQADMSKTEPGPMPPGLAQFENALRKQTYAPVRPKTFLPGQGEFEALPSRERNIERLWSWLSAVDAQENGVPFIRFELLWATGADPLKNLNAYMDHWPRLMDYLVDQAREDINQADPKVVRRKLISVFKLIKKKLALPEFTDPQFVYWRNDIVKHYRKESRLTKDVRDQIDKLLLEKTNLNNLWVNPKYYFNHHLLKSQDMTDAEVAATWPQLGQPVKVNFSIGEGDTGPRINYSIALPEGDSDQDPRGPNYSLQTTVEGDLRTRVVSEPSHVMSSTSKEMAYFSFLDNLNPALVKFYGYESKESLHDFLDKYINEANLPLDKSLEIFDLLYSLDITDPLVYLKNHNDYSRQASMDETFYRTSTPFQLDDYEKLSQPRQLYSHILIMNDLRRAFYLGQKFQIPMYSSTWLHVVLPKLELTGISKKSIVEINGKKYIDVHHPSNKKYHEALKAIEPSGFSKWSHEFYNVGESFNAALKEMTEIVYSLSGKNIIIDVGEPITASQYKDSIIVENPSRTSASHYINKTLWSGFEDTTSISKNNNLFERALVTTIAFNSSIVSDKNKEYSLKVAAHEAWHAWFEVVRFVMNNDTPISSTSFGETNLSKDFKYMEGLQGQKELLDILMWLLKQEDYIKDASYILKFYEQVRKDTNVSLTSRSNIDILAPRVLNSMKKQISEELTRRELQADVAAVLWRMNEQGIKIPGFKYQSIVQRVFAFLKRLAQNIMGKFPTYEPENILSIYQSWIKGEKVKSIETLHNMMATFSEIKTAAEAYNHIKTFRTHDLSVSLLDEEGNPRPIWTIRLTNEKLNKQFETQAGVNIAQTREAARNLAQKISLQYGHTLSPDTTEEGLKAWLTENKNELPPNVVEFLNALEFTDDLVTGGPNDVSFTSPTLDPIIEKLRPSEIRLIQNLSFVKKMEDAEVLVSPGFLKASKNIESRRSSYMALYNLSSTFDKNNPNLNNPNPTFQVNFSMAPETDQGKLASPEMFVPAKLSGKKDSIGAGSGSLRKLRKINKEKFGGTVSLNAWSRWMRSMQDIAADHTEFARYWTLASERQRDRTYILEGMMVDIPKNENRLKALTQLPRSSQRNIFKALEIARRLDRSHLDKAPDGTYQIQVPDMSQSDDPLVLYDIKSASGELIKLSKEESAALDQMVEGISFGLDQIIKAYKINLNFSADTSIDFLKTELAGHEATVKFLKETDDPRAAEIEAAYNRMSDIISDMETLESYKGRHYMPLVRSGEMGISVHKINEDGKKGDLVYFKTFSMDNRGKREWQLIETQLKRDFPSNQYIISDQAFELSDNYKRVTAADALGGLESLASLLPDKMRKSYEEIHKVLVEEAMTRGFQKHLTNARNIAGYDDDIVTAYANFANGVANFSSNITYKNAITKALNVLKEHPQLHQIAADQEEYLTSREEEFTTLRNLGFLMYLGFNITSAALQTFTLPLVYIPYVSQFMSPLVAANKLRYFGKHVAITQHKELKSLDKVPNKQVADDLKELYQMGYLKPMMTLDQAGFAVNQTAHHTRWLGEGWRKMIQASGYAFNKIETGSRIAAARIILEQAHADPKFMDRFNAAHIKDKVWQEMLNQGNGTPRNAAIHVLEKTFGIYGKTSRPRLMRGLGTAVFQFNTYPQQMIELMVRLARGTGMNKKAFAFMMLALLVTSGIQGWPGLENLKVLAETISKDWFGTTLDLETAMRELIVEYTDSVEAAQIITRGLLPSMTGLDVGRRVGLGLIPVAENVLAAVGAYGDNSTLDAFGVAGSLLQLEPWVDAWRNKGFWESANQAPFIPTSFKNVVDALFIWPEEGVRAKAGDELLGADELTWQHIFMKAIGINPTVVAERRAASRAARLEGSSTEEAQSNYYNKLARARVSTIKANRIGDAEAAREAQTTYQQLINEIKEYNRTASPSQKIKIDHDYLKSLIKRLLATNLKGIIKALPKKSRQRAEEITKLYDLMAY